MATDITDPLDALHRDCLDARDFIREAVAQSVKRVRRWEPAPLPTEREET